MNHLLGIPTLELMELWAELVKAYHNCNKYGGNVAEIYAYRFMRYSPQADEHKNEKYIKERNAFAADALKELCVLFSEKYDCKISIDSLTIGRWRSVVEDNWEHRAHVLVNE